MYKKLFVCGASGSGKDTICNYLVSEAFLKLRLAHTIKQIICEKHNLSFDELEELKRTVPEIRLEHNNLGDFMNETNGTLNRIDLLERFEALDFEYLKQIGWDYKKQPKVICDVRNFEESEKLLSYGYHGIYLTRQTGEFKNKDHHTEQNMFFNGQLETLINTFGRDKFTIIYNNSSSDYLIDDEIFKIFEKITLDAMHTNGSSEQLIEIIRNKFINN